MSIINQVPNGKDPFSVCLMISTDCIENLSIPRFPYPQILKTQKGNPFQIQQEHCLHCGNCFEHCPVHQTGLIARKENHLINQG